MGWKTKTISSEWTWISDYAFKWSKWSIHVPTGREIRIGTGVSFRGRPRGTITKAKSGITVITVFGFGAIHAQVADGEGNAEIQFRDGDYDTIKVIDAEF